MLELDSLEDNLVRLHRQSVSLLTESCPSILIHLELWELFHSMNMEIIKVIDNVQLWVRSQSDRQTAIALQQQ